MTGSAWLFLALSAAAAVVDWWAVARSNRSVEYIAKPATLAGLILVALTLEPDVDAMRAWFVAALVLSLIGDVFLMLPRDLFPPGLVSFLLGHLAYIGGFLAAGLDAGSVLLVALPVAVAVVVYAAFLIRNMSESSADMRVPVAVYALVIGSMITCALAVGSAAAAVGALLFVLSDGLIGYSRFVSAPSWGRVAIIVTYHLGQAGLVLALVHL
jgi:uncharacterized membrane protein YhhN